MIIIDYYNFLYFRYGTITKQVITNNLKLLSLFVDDKNIFFKIVFDGTYFQDISFQHKKISLLFSNKESADELIIRIFSNLQGKSHILVSQDKTLCYSVKNKSKADICNPKTLWQSLDIINKYGTVEKEKSPIKKTTEYEDNELDELFYKYYKTK